MEDETKAPAPRLIDRLPLLVICGALAWIAQKSAGRINDPDAWWHLRLGSDLIAQHSLAAPHWSSYADRTWVPTQPLPEIASVYVDRWLGLPGLAWLYAATSMLVLVVVYLVCRWMAAPVAAAMATMLCLLAASESLTSRPQLVSFVLLPIVVTAWLKTEHDQKPRWWLVPLAGVWSLCHGFWFIGVGYGAVAVVGMALSRRTPPRRLLTLAALVLASGAVVLLSPVGLGVFRAPLEVNAISKYVTEWQRTDLVSPIALGVGLMVVTTLLIWATHRPAVSWTRLLLLLSAVFWVWYSVRTVIVGGLVAAPVFASALDFLVRGEVAADERPAPIGVPEWRPIAAWSALCLVVVALVVPHTAAEPGGVPTALDGQLDRLPAGTGVFNAFELGGWIAWRHPDLDQYIDGLADAYTPVHFVGYIRAVGAAPGWYATVRRSGASVALLEGTSPLTQALEGRGWTVRGRSDGYVLLTRPGTAL